MDSKSAYAAALEALKDEEVRLRLEVEARTRKLQEVASLIAGLERLMSPEDPDPELEGFMGVERNEFRDLTMRDAIKKLLADREARSEEPPSTAQISDRLRAGGFRTKGKNLLSNVSAVLSLMANTHKEVFSENGRWRLEACTANGAGCR